MDTHALTHAQTHTHKHVHTQSLFYNWLLYILNWASFINTEIILYLSRQVTSCFIRQVITGDNTLSTTVILDKEQHEYDKKNLILHRLENIREKR